MTDACQSADREPTCLTSSNSQARLKIAKTMFVYVLHVGFTAFLFICIV